jgi:predicted P-loop ATPase
MEKFDYKLESSEILDEWIEKSRRKNKFVDEWEKRIEKEAIAMS